MLQRWEKYLTKDGRETFVIYSLGNFASHQHLLPRRSTMILYLGLRQAEDGTVAVDGVRYIPLHVRENDKKFYVEAIDRVDGPPESRALTVDMFGEAHLMKPDDDLVTNPHCNPDWGHYVR